MAAVYTLGGFLVGMGGVSALQDGRWGWVLLFGAGAVISAAISDKLGR